MKMLSFFLPFFALLALASCQQPEVPSNDTEILSIGEGLDSKPLESVDPETHDYKVILPHGTDLSALDLDLQLASTEASYSPLTPQDFSNNTSITFTVTAEDGTTQQIYNITVELAPIEPSTDTSITSIGKELGSKPLKSVDPETHDYKVILPHGTDLSALDLDLQLASTEASYSPLTPQDFSNNTSITFTVTAEDGTTQQIYNITVELAPIEPSTDTSITSIGKELGSKLLESVGPETHDYKVILPHGTDLSALDLDLQLASTEASYSPLTPQDFSNNNPITFTVTAEDGTTQQIYSITVELAPIEPSTDTSITSIGKELGSKLLESVGPETHDYKVILPHGTDLSALDLDLQLASTEASYRPLTPQDFSNNNPITFTVTAEDGTTQQIYSITVELAPIEPSTDTSITSIGKELGSKLLESVGPETHDYKVILPHGTDLSALDLDLQLASTEASYRPLTPQDFSNNNPITFTVTAADGTTQQIYSITVELAPSTDTSITSIGKELGSKLLESVGPETHDYKVILPHGTDLSALDLDLQLASTEASYSPLTPQDFSNNNPITFTVTAADGTTQQIYSITVELAPSTDTSITSIGKELGSKLLESVGPETHDYKVILPHGTDLSALDLDLQLASTEASYSPLTPQDFSNNNPITFTVTAADGTTQQIYSITVELAPSTDTSITSIGKELGSKPLKSVDPETNDYKVILPHGTDLSALDLDLQLASTEASYSPLTPQDFSNNNPITFTVTAADGTTQQIYNITVELAPSTAANIISIHQDLGGAALTAHQTNIDSYLVKIPPIKDLKEISLRPEISPGASYEPQTPQDFSNNNPIPFTVTAADGTTTKIYNITVAWTFLVKKDDAGKWNIVQDETEGTRTGIWKIEDLVRLGTADTSVSGDMWKSSDDYVLMENLDFKKEGDYRNPTDTNINADEDSSTTEGIMAELIPNEATLPTNPGFLPIQSFAGNFDGNRKTISHLYIKRTKNLTRTLPRGLFGMTTDSTKTIEKLGILNAYVHGAWFGTGILVGRNMAMIKQIYTTGEVKGADHVGGIIGSGNSSETVVTAYIEESYSTATVEGSNYIGGLVGRLDRFSVKNSTSFSTKIKSSFSGHRITGNSSSIVLNRNYANINMTLNGTPASGEPSNNNVNGASINATNFSDLVFYKSPARFDPLWDFDNVWEIKKGAERPTFIGSPDAGLLSPANP